MKKLPHCEHSARMLCSADPTQVRCTAICKAEMVCCGKPCPSECGQCQQHNTRQEQHLIAGVTPRIKHGHHPCTKTLPCQHPCGGDCSDQHDCSEVICTKPCQQRCEHHRCGLPCSAPCAPCKEFCKWICDHQKCPLSCGAVSVASRACLDASSLTVPKPCARLPCDLRCSSILACGHQCPSGE